MAEKKTPQRLGIERLIEAGDLPIAVGPVMLDVPTPTAPTPALTVSEGPCGNAGAWCAEGPVTALLGWRRKLCDACYREWRSVVLGI
jgi:hypothetical protein